MASPGETGAAADGETRRDFLYLTTGAFGAVAVGAVAWPFIHQMNPAADTLAASTTEVDLSPIKVGQSITVKWQGKPVFVRRRTAAEIASAKQAKADDMIDPETDDKRTHKPEWLVVIGVCTHLGCIPKGQAATEPRGEYGGWFCPCHGSHYDTSGRIRKGPAPRNLAVPFYEFVKNNVIRIGKEVSG